MLRDMSLAFLITGFAAFPLALTAQEAKEALAPESATKALTSLDVLSDAARAALASKQAGKPVVAQDWMVVAANPLAVEAGARVLRAGGSAADAMVAVQAVLGLVEPQSSGLGGGSMLVWYDAASGEITTLDGRETAPLAAYPELFLDASGQPLEFLDAVTGGRSVGTPGTPRLLEQAHERWGKSDWPGLFSDAIRLAEEGFPVSPRLAELVAIDAERLGRYQATADYFLPGGKPIAAGTTLTNPGYAATLKAIAEGGAEVFYTGEIAADIVATVTGAEGNPGVLSDIDLALYRVLERPAVCAAYRAHEVCGMGPPSSGGLAVGRFGALDSYDLGKSGPESIESWRLIGDASRLAFADRGRYVADSDFVPVPVSGLIAPDYLKGRGELLKGDKALTEVAPGTPEWDHASLQADDESIEFPSTSHIAIVDKEGNALSMTTTIENGFGSMLFVRGFLLNNELTDFSFATQENGVPIANRVEPGKRPRSSMAPTIVLKDDKPVLVVGSPGGSRIIGYVAQAIIARLDWGMDVQQAVAMPHLVNRTGPYDVEEGTPVAGALADGLAGIGYEVSARELNSGLHAISIGEDLEGGADPRREGIALGE